MAGSNHIQDYTNLNYIMKVNADGSINVAGTISATNPSVGTNASAAPTSSTEVGFIDGSGNLQGVSATNPLPIAGSITASLSGFTPNGTSASLAVTTSSANVALPSGTVVAVANNGSVAANIKLSTTAGSAATTDFALLAGATIGLTVGSNGFINAITATGSTTLSITGGSGLVTGFGSAGSGGGTSSTVAISQATPGSTNAVDATNFAVTQDQNAGAAGASTLRVAIATGGATPLPTGAATSALQTSVGATAHTDAAAINTTLGTPMQTTGGTVGLVAGTAVIGHVIVDSGTVTANAGTNLNTSALALESGGNLAILAGGVTSAVYQDNIKQVNGVTVLTGAGASGTGSQRHTVAQDTTTLAGSAPGTAGTASANVLTVQGVASMTPVQVSQTTAANLNATVSIAAAQTLATVTTVGAVTAITNALPAGTNLLGKTGIDQTTVGTTNAVSLAYVGSTAVASSNGVSGAGSQRVNIASDNSALPAWGQGATAAAVPAGAQYHGLIASTANPSASTAGNLVGAMADKLGRQVVVIGNVRDNKGNTQTALSASSETTVVAAVASTFLDIYGCIAANASASAVTLLFKDSTAGTTQFELEVPAGDTRGFMLPSSDAFKQSTINNNWTCTGGASSVSITMLWVKNI